MFTVDPLTFIISVPQTDLTLISGTIYEMDTESFRDDLKTWEASLEGIVFTRTHDHNTEATIAGTTYARGIQIIDPYSIEIEDGQYTVILKGSNNNIFDVENGFLEQNQVQVIPTNAAGLIVKEVGSGVTPDDIDDIADAVWDEAAADHQSAGSTGEALDEAAQGTNLTIPTAAENADAIWNEDLSTYSTADTAGNILFNLAKKIINNVIAIIFSK